MYEINWTTFVAWLWPPAIRNTFWVQFCRALIAPVVTIDVGRNYFQQTRTDNLYKLKHTSQVCSLTGALNDRFDPVERRIRIDDAGGYEVMLLYPDSDEVPIILNDDASGALLLQNDSGYDGGSFDFVVKTPYAFSQEIKYQLRAIVDYYKLAGKRYDVNP